MRVCHLTVASVDHSSAEWGWVDTDMPMYRCSEWFGCRITIVSDARMHGTFIGMENHRSSNELI